MTFACTNRQTLAVITATLLYVTFIPDVSEGTTPASFGLMHTYEIAAAEVDASPSVAVTEGGAVVTSTTAPPPPTTIEPWPSDRVLAALRQCESTGNYRQVGTWDGHPSKYSGAYQFDQSTWNATASDRRPDLIGVLAAHASPSDQDQMARWLWQDRGPSPWPTCGPKAARA